MFTLFEERLVRKIWDGGDYKMLNKHEYFFSRQDYQVADSQVREYLKGKTIVRFAIAFPKDNFDREMIEKEFIRFCRKLGLLRDVKFLYSNDRYSIEFTAYPKIEFKDN